MVPQILKWKGEFLANDSSGWQMARDMAPREQENEGPDPLRESPLERRLAELRSELSAITDPQARFAHLVEKARLRPDLSPEDRLDIHRVEGCQVRIWWIAESRDGLAWFRCDSDAVSLKAMGGLLCDFYSGATPAEIVGQGPAFLSEFQLLSTLAESRRRTVWRIREKIRDYANQLLAGEISGPP